MLPYRCNPGGYYLCSHASGLVQLSGTEKAFLSDANADLVADLGRALNQIRSAAVRCEFSGLKESAGTRVDTSLVNVLVSQKGTNDALIPMTLKGEASGCGTGNGWYYDAPAAPTSIKLCESTCQAAREGADVKIQYGCRTVVAEAR